MFDTEAQRTGASLQVVQQAVTLVMPVLLELTAVTFLPGRHIGGSGVAWVDLHTLPVEVLTISVLKGLNANPAWSDGFREYDQFCPTSTRLAAMRLQSGASLQVKSKLPFGEGAFAASSGFVTYHAAGMAPAVEHMFNGGTQVHGSHTGQPS